MYVVAFHSMQNFIAVQQASHFGGLGRMPGQVSLRRTRGRCSVAVPSQTRDHRPSTYVFSGSYVFFFWVIWQSDDFLVREIFCWSDLWLFYHVPATWWLFWFLKLIYHRY
jgi:hypothetical protein